MANDNVDYKPNKSNILKKNMEDKSNPFETTLKVTRTESNSSEAIPSLAEVEAQMKEQLNAKGNALMFQQLMKNPMISDAITQGVAMLPMGVDKAKEYFQNGEVRIMLYYDSMSGAFVFEKIREENVNMTYIKDTPPEDFFFVTKEDLDNPQGFVKKMQAKIGFNLF